MKLQLTRNKLMLLPAVFFCLSMLFFTGCASLPLPNEPEDSLYIIPTEFTIQEPDRWNQIAGFSMIIKETRSTDAEEYKVRIKRKGYSSIALPPGEYILSWIIVNWRSKGGGRNWTSKIYHGTKFKLEKNTVYLDTRSLRITQRYNRVTSGTVGLYENEKKQAYLKDLQEDPMWLAWEGYQLVNFKDQ